MIQSVGMTKRQLRKMLICEGLDYAAITLIVSYIVIVTHRSLMAKNRAYRFISFYML